MNVSAHDKGLEPIFVHVFQSSWQDQADFQQASLHLSLVKVLALYVQAILMNGQSSPCFCATCSKMSIELFGSHLSRRKPFAWGSHPPFFYSGAVEGQRHAVPRHFNPNGASIALFVQWEVVDQVASEQQLAIGRGAHGSFLLPAACVCVCVCYSANTVM